MGDVLAVNDAPPANWLSACAAFTDVWAVSAAIDRDTICAFAEEADDSDNADFALGGETAGGAFGAATPFGSCARGAARALVRARGTGLWRMFGWAFPGETRGGVWATA